MNVVMFYDDIVGSVEMIVEVEVMMTDEKVRIAKERKDT